MAKKQAETNGAVKSVRKSDYVVIEIPIDPDEGANCYTPQHIDLQLSPREGLVVKRIRSAMCRMNEIRINGRDPSFADVVRLVLSRVDDELMSE